LPAPTPIYTLSLHDALPISNAEEIAFYNGAELEHSILNRTYHRLIRHINSIYKIRIAYNMFEDFLIKYCWSASGLAMCAIPVFLDRKSTRLNSSHVKISYAV